MDIEKLILAIGVMILLFGIDSSKTCSVYFLSRDAIESSIACEPEFLSEYSKSGKEFLL